MSDFDTLIGLVSQYSPSGQERGAVEWLVTRMKSLGYDASFIDEAGNAVGVMGQGSRQVVLLGHIDTVPGEIEVTLTPDPYPEGHISPSGGGGLLYGRGSVDAKGPLACFVDAVAKVGGKEGWQFVVIGAVEEERDSDGRVMLSINTSLTLPSLASQTNGIGLRLVIRAVHGRM